MIRLILLTAIPMAAAATAAVLPGPRALLPAQPGLWAVSTSADGHHAQRVCVRELRMLAQWEHRGRACRQTILSDSGSVTRIGYQCAANEFGESKLTLITPRTMRIETQGIASSYPFRAVLHARRIGPCPRPR